MADGHHFVGKFCDDPQREFMVFITVQNFVTILLVV